MTAPRIVPSIEALEDLAGETLGPGDWVTVDQTMIDAFAEATGDRQWIHVDRERAAATPLGRTVAHGYLTLALLPRLLGELVQVEATSEVLNYAIRRAVFPAPIPCGTRVRLAVGLRSALRAPGGGRSATWDVTIEVEGAERPALDAQVVYLYRPVGDATA